MVYIVYDNPLIALNFNLFHVSDAQFSSLKDTKFKKTPRLLFLTSILTVYLLHLYCI